MHVMRAQEPATVAELAGRQYGVVTRSQLTASGLDRGWVQRAVAAGRLLRLHRPRLCRGPPCAAAGGDVARRCVCLRRLSAPDRAWRRGIPVTSAARTIVACDLDDHEF